MSLYACFQRVRLIAVSFSDVPFGEMIQLSRLREDLNMSSEEMLRYFDKVEEMCHISLPPDRRNIFTL
ncbi:MAG: hypothetical protein COU08_01565 [Candidatus Harrisonbacteria bacterium CG10_big_fil_rev_8_21_14_0_10_42_17]|uniref:Uncharacterized protein n=1 Tax=Candidatus Harrisonbacteria bacterium CG10_big_fil_rev_8_21_14_0_10_42_17 TaxID=1974584 RepID=A0A2M6WIR9_9BACT|nr:MAG: hypothetical protein COU08_01565 [Candidatus Harrisonbacteria bacterium CG10_big_fil_rev_8_21_14_0_10_42_17]